MNLINKNELFLLEEIVKRNFSSKYKDSTIGIFWSVLKPLLIMAVFTIIFSTLFGRNIRNFPVYFLTAKCIFDFFNGAVGMSLNSIKGNKRILQRTAAPKYIFVLGTIISEFLNFLISLALLVGVMIVTKQPFYFSIMPLAVIPITSILMMVTGLGLMLAIFCVYYTDIQHLWGVVSLILMYSSAIFYPMRIVPQPYYYYMNLNPLYWIIDQFRRIIYIGVIPNKLNMINSILLSSIILVLGVIIYKKFEKKVAMKF